MSSLPPGTCLSRIGFSIPTARRCSSSVANSRSRAFRQSIFYARKSPYEYVHSVRIELAKLILVGTRITYQATGDASYTINSLRQECNYQVWWKRESMRMQNSMKIHDQWEWTLCAIKMNRRTGGKRGRREDRRMWARLVQNATRINNSSKSSHYILYVNIWKKQRQKKSQLWDRNDFSK